MRPVALAVLLVALLLLGVVALPFGALDQPAYGEGHYGEPGPGSGDRPEPPPTPQPAPTITGPLWRWVEFCAAAWEYLVPTGGASRSGNLVAALRSASTLGSTSQAGPRALLRYWDSGQPVTEADRAQALPIEGLQVLAARTGITVQFRTGVKLADVRAFPVQYRASFDLPDRRGGAQNHFAGPGFEEDLWSTPVRRRRAGTRHGRSPGARNGRSRRPSRSRGIRCRSPSLWPPWPR